MNTVQHVAVKVVRWTGWLLLPVVLVFFLTGYAIAGRYGLASLTDERTALAWHNLLHLPLAVLFIAHVIPSAFLAFIRWGWIKTNV